MRHADGTVDWRFVVQFMVAKLVRAMGSNCMYSPAFAGRRNGLLACASWQLGFSIVHTAAGATPSASATVRALLRKSAHAYSAPLPEQLLNNTSAFQHHQDDLYALLPLYGGNCSRLNVDQRQHTILHCYQQHYHRATDPSSYGTHIWRLLPTIATAMIRACAQQHYSQFLCN